jgi:hypothetical protein
VQILSKTVEVWGRYDSDSDSELGVISCLVRMLSYVSLPKNMVLFNRVFKPKPVKHKTRKIE